MSANPFAISCNPAVAAAHYAEMQRLDISAPDADLRAGATWIVGWKNLEAARKALSCSPYPISDETHSVVTKYCAALDLERAVQGACAPRRSFPSQSIAAE